MFRRALGVLAATSVATVAAVAATTPSSASTGGEGGAFNDRTFQSFTASNGLSSQYHVYADGLPADEPVGILLQFHGDGAYEFQNPSSSYALGGSDGVVAQAREHGMITVPVLTPDTDGSVTWWEQGAENADFVRDLLDQLYGQYNIDQERVWLVGYSGGSQFITQYFLPQHSAMIGGGGSVVFGGGGAPFGAAWTADAGLTADFPMHWYTGQDDNGSYDALQDANKGSAWYGGQGFATSLETPAGVAHDLSGTFGAVVGQQLDAHDGGPAAAPAVPAPAVPAPAPAAGTAAPATGATTPGAVATPGAPEAPEAGAPPAPAGPVTAEPAPTEQATAAPAELPAVEHTVTPGRRGATLEIDVPEDTERLTFRVSKAPITGQTGWYKYTGRTGEGVELNIRRVLTPGTDYHYQVERGRDHEVVAAGTFTTR